MQRRELSDMRRQDGAGGLISSSTYRGKEKRMLLQLKLLFLLVAGDKGLLFLN